MSTKKSAPVRIASSIKTHGGKGPLAARLVSLMPKHTHFVEAYCGGMSVLLAKSPEGVSEVVNDTNQDLVNSWRTIRG